MPSKSESSFQNIPSPLSKIDESKETKKTKFKGKNKIKEIKEKEKEKEKDYEENSLSNSSLSSRNSYKGNKKKINNYV